MKRVATIVVAAVAAMGLMAASATAAPNATIDIKINPKAKTGDSPVPAGLSIAGTITPPAGTTTVDPLYNLTTRFPKDMTFSTNGVPPCTEDIGQFGDYTKANISSAAARQKCAASIVGDGTAELYLAGNAAGGAFPTDPVLSAFNGGRDNNGNPRVYIHGYSPITGVGVIMIGSLINGTLSLDIPVLTGNSAVAKLNLNLPGDIGKDPKFVQVKCTSGTWASGAKFSFGQVKPGNNVGKSGLDVFSPTDSIDVNSASQSCTKGTNGSGFSGVNVKGPKQVKQGKTGTYKVTVKASKTVKGVKVVARGKGAKGKKTAGTIKAGKSKTVKVKVKFSKKGKIKTNFKVMGKGAKAKSKKITVRVK